MMTALWVHIAGSAAAAATAPVSGITIAPAAIQLTLPVDSAEASTTFAVTNNYTTAVSMHFAFETARDRMLVADTARRYLQFRAADITITPGETVQQLITLRDTPAIAPGSQAVDLVITQQSSPGSGVGVLPSLRLPVTITKQDGATTSLGLTTISGPTFAISAPATITVILRNTGNTITVPRGVVTVTAPDGTVVGQGVLNEASVGLAPGTNKTFDVRLTAVHRALLPGPYKVQVAYGLGGDSTAQTATTTFAFVAWWHAAAAGALVLGWWYGLRLLHIWQWRRLARSGSRLQTTAKGIR